MIRSLALREDETSSQGAGQSPSNVELWMIDRATRRVDRTDAGTSACWLDVFVFGLTLAPIRSCFRFYLWLRVSLRSVDLLESEQIPMERSAFFLFQPRFVERT
jgi:hypothetical protein